MKARILVVEDEPSINTLVCLNLETAGYETSPFFEGGSLLTHLEKDERYDLAILDIMLPGMDGFAILPVLTKCTCDMDISRITLGYSRIYDPWADPYTGYLVPVWDFFGEYTETRNSENASYTFTHRSPDISLLTVNAVDGSIINRSLGY